VTKINVALDRLPQFKSLPWTGPTTGRFGREERYLIGNKRYQIIVNNVTLLFSEEVLNTGERFILERKALLRLKLLIAKHTMACAPQRNITFPLLYMIEAAIDYIPQ